MARTEQINPEILTWARETAGMSLEQGAEKLGFKDTLKASAVEKLRAIEMGTGDVSAKLVERAAGAYRRPLIAFYLPKPPLRGERGEDFRQLSGTVSARDNGMLDALIRDVKARQQMLREVLVENEEAFPISFVGVADFKEHPATTAEDIRAKLGVTTSDQQNARGPDGLFRLLRSAAERNGIYVLLLGDLGTHHSDIGENVFRGFALSDRVAPFVVINDNDAVAARSFTLMHELAHIWVGASGVSGPLESMSQSAAERFCNDVAGEFLLPIEEVAFRWLDGFEGPSPSVNSALVATERLSRDWNVSQGLATFQLARAKVISNDVASNLFRIFASRWRSEQQAAKAEKEDGGPSYYVVRQHRLGAPMLDVVRRAIQGATLSHTRAAKILGVAPSSVDGLLQVRARSA